MTGLKLGAILLIIAGTLGLVYGGFRYSRNTQTTTLGPIGFSVRVQESVAVPVWASVAAILAGSVLLLAGQRRSRA